MIAETERLIISKFTVEDAPFFLELVNSPHWIKYIGDRNIKTLLQAEQGIINGHIKSYETHGFGFYKLTLKETNKFIGTVGLIKRDTLEHVDIGFAFLPEYEGYGYGFESSKAILKLAKDEFKLKTILAITLSTNKPSIKLLEKLGLSFQKMVKPFEDDKELMLFVKNLNNDNI
jgi:RimJ/RimL family protein N-acetyltransferase